MVTKSDTIRCKVSAHGIDHLSEGDQIRLIMFGNFQTALENNYALPTHTKAIKHSLQFKTVTTIRRILNRCGDSIKAFTQAAIAQKITIGPYNAALIAAVDLIRKKLGSLISKSATSPDEIKVRKDALQHALL